MDGSSTVLSAEDGSSIAVLKEALTEFAAVPAKLLSLCHADAEDPLDDAALIDAVPREAGNNVVLFVLTENPVIPEMYWAEFTTEIKWNGTGQLSIGPKGVQWKGQYADATWEAATQALGVTILVPNQRSEWLPDVVGMTVRLQLHCTEALPCIL